MNEIKISAPPNEKCKVMVELKLLTVGTETVAARFGIRNFCLNSALRVNGAILVFGQATEREKREESKMRQQILTFSATEQPPT